MGLIPKASEETSSCESQGLDLDTINLEALKKHINEKLLILSKEHPPTTIDLLKAAQELSILALYQNFLCILASE